jgi:hypothetical protein
MLLPACTALEPVNDTTQRPPPQQDAGPLGPTSRDSRPIATFRSGRYMPSRSPSGPRTCRSNPEPALRSARPPSQATSKPDHAATPPEKQHSNSRTSLTQCDVPLGSPVRLRRRRSHPSPALRTPLIRLDHSGLAAHSCPGRWVAHVPSGPSKMGRVERSEIRHRLKGLWPRHELGDRSQTNHAKHPQQPYAEGAGIGRGRRYVLGGTHTDDLYRRIGTPYTGVTGFLR